MKVESVAAIQVLDTGELLLTLDSLGSPAYQYVYRGAAGVYWDNNRHGFKSTPMTDMSASQWYFHIVAIVRNELGVDLRLGETVTWDNIASDEQGKIEGAHAT